MDLVLPKSPQEWQCFFTSVTLADWEKRRSSLIHIRHRPPWHWSNRRAGIGQLDAPPTLLLKGIGGFLSHGGPQKYMVYNGKSHSKWMIWGYHHFWKPPIWCFTNCIPGPPASPLAVAWHGLWTRSRAPPDLLKSVATNSCFRYRHGSNWSTQDQSHLLPQLCKSGPIPKIHCGCKRRGFLDDSQVSDFCHPNSSDPQVASDLLIICWS